MERLKQAPDVENLVAPGEVRELLSRLTERSIDAIPMGEPRTVEGLAAETGIPTSRIQTTLDEMRGRVRRRVPPAAWAFFAFLIGLSFLAFRPTTSATVSPAPAPVATPTVQTDFDRTGLVDATQVAFGPDSGVAWADPSFAPAVPTRPGVSLSVSIGGVMWGCGERRSTALRKPLSALEADALEATIEEALRYARASALKRKMPFSTGLDGQWSATILLGTYNGSASGSAKIGAPGKDEVSDANAIRRGAREAVQGLQDSLTIQSRFNRE